MCICEESIMRNEVLKKFDKKKQLMVSPFALAVSACGGGGAEEEITPSLSAVKKFDPTGDELIDMVTSGSYFRNSSSEPIFYGLAHGHYGEQWENPEAVAGVLQDVMSEFPKYADIDLKYAGIYSSPNAASDAGVSVVLSLDKFVFEANGSTSNWNAWYPHGEDDDFGVKEIGGDLYLNFYGPVWKATDQQDFERIITESDVARAMLLNGMGLTIGLKNTESSTSVRPEIADTRFAENFEDYTYSVSHIPYNGLSDDVGNTLGVYDILGLIYLYGPATDVNLGDTTHDLSNVSEYTVVSDSGGEDTLTFSATDRDVHIALPERQITEDEYTSLVDVAVGGGAISMDTPQEVVIGIVGNIENIITGSGDDVIYTNSSDNLVNAGSGDDIILLSSGKDTVYGGAGADTFYAEWLIGNLWQYASNTVIKDFEVGVDTLDIPHSPEDDIFSHNEDGYATYTTSYGVNIVLEGIEANVLMIA